MKPLEASGTSGMKAALNGVPSFSVLDGWWVEGHVEGVTGWSIGAPDAEGDPARDALDLYIKLERVILPLFYGLPFAYAEVMRVGDRAECELLQHAAHGAAVRAQRVLPGQPADGRADRGDRTAVITA